MNEYCDFHCDKGHVTNECIQIRKEIEVAIKSGELAHLVREIKDNKKGGKKKQENCMMISGGTSKKLKARHNSWAQQAIMFQPLESVAPSMAPMVISTQIGGMLVRQIYIDGRATSDIMYGHCFNTLPKYIQSQL
jgi:hypothetical protein